MQEILAEFLKRVRAINGINEPISWAGFPGCLAASASCNTLSEAHSVTSKYMARRPKLGELQNDVARLQEQVATLDGSLRRWELGRIPEWRTGSA